MVTSTLRAHWHFPMSASITPPASAPVRQTSPLAIVSLVFGLLGWSVLPLIGSMVAVVTGHLARAEVRRPPERYEGDGLAIAGLILGYTAVALGALALLLILVFFGGLFAVVAAS